MVPARVESPRQGDDDALQGRTKAARRIDGWSRDGIGSETTRFGPLKRRIALVMVNGKPRIWPAHYDLNGKLCG